MMWRMVALAWACVACSSELAITNLGASVDEAYGTVVHIDWSQSGPADVHLEFGFGDDDRTSPERALDAGDQHELLLGLPYGHEVQYRVVAERGLQRVTTPWEMIDTRGAPDGLPVASVLTADPKGYDPGSAYVFLAVEASDGDWNLMVDRQGRVVWGSRLGPRLISLHPRVSYDGATMLLDRNAFWGGEFSLDDSVIDRIRIDGTVVESFSVPGFHHAFTELPNGRLAYGRIDTTGPGRDEALTIVAADGSLETVWRCSEWLSGLGQEIDCGSNTVTFDPETNTFLYSFYSLDTIVQIDADGGDALRWFGSVPGAWQFDPPESRFVWQHGGHFTDQGTLLTSAHTLSRDEIVVREYQLDGPAQTLTQTYSLGVGEGLFGDVMGEPHRLGNGNTLHNMGSLPRLREATPAGEIVWDLSWEDDGADSIGRSTPIADLYRFR